MRRILLLSLAAFCANACGDDAPTGPEPPAGALRYSQIDVGYFHTCALSLSGDAYCWGGNTTGALGDGTSQLSARPRPVAGAHDFVAIDAGAAHTCALDAAGAAWCWGHNDEGQLGDGSFSPRSLPTRVDLDAPLRAISAGHAHSCALATTLEIWCWGDDSAGQLGDGPPNGAARKPTPVRVALPPAEYVAVHAGYYQTCALDASHAAYCWGRGSSGENGDGSDSTRHVPTAVALPGAVERIAPGDRFVCAIADGDAVLCWGANRHGELMTTPGANRLLPMETGLGDADVVATSMGTSTIGGSEAYACAILDDGRARCWGGAVPALREREPTPTLLDDALRFESLALGPQFVCALDRSGYAYCGGANAAGELGVGDADDRPRMTPVAAP